MEEKRRGGGRRRAWGNKTREGGREREREKGEGGPHRLMGYEDEFGHENHDDEHDENHDDDDNDNEDDNDDDDNENDNDDGRIRIET